MEIKPIYFSFSLRYRSRSIFWLVISIALFISCCTTVQSQVPHNHEVPEEKNLKKNRLSLIYGEIKSKHLYFYCNFGTQEQCEHGEFLYPCHKRNEGMVHYLPNSQTKLLPCLKDGAGIRLVCPTKMQNVVFEKGCTGDVYKECNFSCQSGFVSSETVTSCELMGEWSNVTAGWTGALCQPKAPDCPINKPNVTFEKGCKGELHESCHFTCSPGFLSENNVSFCIENKHLSDIPMWNGTLCQLEVKHLEVSTDPKFEDWKIWVIISVFAVVMVIIGMALRCCCCRKKRKNPSPDPSNEHGLSLLIATSSLSTQPTTSLSGTQPTTSSSGTQPTTSLSGTQPTTSLSGTQPITSLPGTQPTTSLPGTQQTTSLPGTQPTTSLPGTQPTTSLPGTQATTSLPGTQPTTSLPGTQATTSLPGTQPTTSLPGIQPTTSLPGTQPTTSLPGTQPTTSLPGTQPTTSLPGTQPTTSSSLSDATLFEKDIKLVLDGDSARFVSHPMSYDKQGFSDLPLENRPRFDQGTSFIENNLLINQATKAFQEPLMTLDSPKLQPKKSSTKREKEEPEVLESLLGACGKDAGAIALEPCNTTFNDLCSEQLNLSFLRQLFPLVEKTSDQTDDNTMYGFAMEYLDYTKRAVDVERYKYRTNELGPLEVFMEKMKYKDISVGDFLQYFARFGNRDVVELFLRNHTECTFCQNLLEE